VGAVLGNPRVGNALFWCIGAVWAIVIGLSGWHAGALSGLKQVNPILLTAGAIGASLVFAIAWLIPQIGAGPMTLYLLSGQIIGGLVLSHFGWLGSPVAPISMMTIVGTLVMIAGVVLATRG
jgi:transporter family-2 protein